MSHAFTGDGSEPTYTDQRRGDESSEGGEFNARLKVARSKFRQFLRDWRYEETFIYRDQLKDHYIAGTYSLEVDFVDVIHFDKDLSDNLQTEPGSFLPLFEQAAQEIVAEGMLPKPSIDKLNPIQIMLRNFQGRATRLRELDSKDISKLISIKGIAISTYKPQCKATKLVIQCTKCKSTQDLACPKGFGSAPIPRQCPTNSISDGQSEQCPMDPFVVLPDKSKFVDIQKLRLQEMPEDVPTGEMPRHISLSVERNLVNKVNAGARVEVIGIYSIFQAKDRSRDQKQSANVRFPYIRVIGLISTAADGTHTGDSVTPEEEEEFQRLARNPRIYPMLAESLAPAIYGHEDVKKSIISLMFGGTRKRLPSGSNLRGDINVLLLGDPSLGKSQLLKAVKDSAPIAVFTSGKGSSAAGLTAAVIRDAHGEFHLEGGAMVLADGGVVCIDEFDKMRDDDRVAIHEAMEQQTISIAKAGITTILNSRTSVLAAANPTFGRYDDLKKATENIDFETTILSRFDLIFILKDPHDAEYDARMALHVLAVHQQKVTETVQEAPIEREMFTKYIGYCRANCQPQLNQEAAELLRNHYVSFREEAKKRRDLHGMAAIPITVRQLEAIVRLSESFAKMELSREATPRHVQEAVRLFKVATMKAASSGETLLHSDNADFIKDTQAAERHLRRRLQIGSKWNYRRVLTEMTNKGMSEESSRQAIQNMTRRSEVVVQNQGRTVFRKK
eukprot:202004_1